MRVLGLHAKLGSSIFARGYNRKRLHDIEAGLEPQIMKPQVLVEGELGCPGERDFGSITSGVCKIEILTVIHFVFAEDILVDRLAGKILCIVDPLLR